MTAVSRTLTLRTKLLVAEFGRKRVIAALAQAEDVEFEAIEREVQGISKRRSSRSRRVKTVPELLRDAKIDSDKHTLVEKVAFAYENRRFLPELWRVRRFLESRGMESSRIGSRAAALPAVVRVLVELTEKELIEILAGLNGPVKGDLRIIADHIMKSSGCGSEVAKGVEQKGGARGGRKPAETAVRSSSVGTELPQEDVR